MASFVVAVPSYKRPELFLHKTYNVLATSQLLEKTYVFVVPEEEEKYRTAFPLLRIIVGKPGLSEQLKFIDNYFPEGTHIVRIDDDIDYFLDISGHRITDIRPTISRGFVLCMAKKARFWGIYPVANPFFMKKDETFNLKFIQGCLCGWIKKGDPHIPEESIKEDIYRSCAYYKADGCVVRLNDIAPKTKFLRGDSLIPTKEAHERGADTIVAAFPGWATKYYRKNGFPEIRLTRHTS